MFMFSRLSLLSSCLILLKIVIAVTKAMYLTVLKVCRKIKFTLKCDENSHFSQNGRRSEMDSHNNPLLSSTRSRTSKIVNQNHHSPSVDFLIYNLPIGKKITVRHLKRYEVVTDSSEITSNKPNNFPQGMTIQETNHPVWFEPRKAFDGEIPRTSLDCSTPLNHVYITSLDRNNQNQAKGIGSLSESLRSSQNEEQPSGTKFFVKPSDGSAYLQMQIFDQNIKSHLNKSNHTMKEISELDSLNVPAQYVEERHKLHAFPSKAVTPCRRSVETFSFKNSDESVYLEQKKMTQSNEARYFKDNEHNSDSYLVKSNAFHSSYTMTDNSLGVSEIDCQNDENDYKKTEDRGEIVAETNNKELYLSYPKDDSRFTLCSQDETKGSSESFCKNLKTLEFQGKVLLETRKVNNIEESEGSLNHFKATYVDKCNMECSDSPIKKNMLYDEVCNRCSTETVQDTEKAPENTERMEISTAKALVSSVTGRNENVQDIEITLENTKHGEILTANDLLSTSVNDTTETVGDTEKALENTEHGENLMAQASLSTVTYIKINKSTPSSTPIPGASNELRGYDKAAYLCDLVKMKPVICSLENAMLSWCDRTIGISGSTIETEELEVLWCCVNFLQVRAIVMTNTPFNEDILTYTEEIKSIFMEIKDVILCPSSSGNDEKKSSYVNHIRRKLVKKRKILLADSEELNKIFTEGKGILKTRISRKSKSKNKRRRR